MTILEITLSVLTLLLSGTSIVQIVSIGSIKRKYKAEADKERDSVLYKHVMFLDERVSNLEKKACYKKDCPERI